jgi:hypothetical protein
MNDFQMPVPPPALESPGLSQVQRVIYTFTAPSKTFNDIKRSTSWWLPFLISVVFVYAFFAAVSAKVTWPVVAENNMKMSPKQAEQMEKMTPEQRASQMKIVAITTEAGFAAAPVFALIGTAIVAGVLFATINFGFGGKATFWQVFSVSFYAGLPGVLKFLLGTIALFAGLDAETFKIGNFAGTNVGYYLPADTSKTLMALATSLDLVTIWTLVLTAIGLSIVAGTKRSAAYIAVFGWWVIVVIVSVGAAAAFS